MSFYRLGQYRGALSPLRIGSWIWLLVACLSGPVAASDANLLREGDAQAVTRTVIGILGYTRWPGERDELQLCIAGASEYTDTLMASSGQVITGRRLGVKRVDPEQAKLECDALYVGNMDAKHWRKLMQQETGRPLLTISEHIELCRIGAMFCLVRQGDGPGFEVNLDSIARSGLRISPKVLQLARSKASS